MTCEEFELALVTEETSSAAAREHLAGCAKCRDFEASSAVLLADAALAVPAPEERQALSVLAPRLHQSWKQLERRRSVARRVVGFAVAACFGAAVASAALLPRVNTHALTAVAMSDVPDVSFPVSAELDPVSDSSDELDAFEVSWPSPEEGVAP
jgi:hypothetical protein